MESKYFPFLVTYLSFKLDESLFTQHKSRENPFVHCLVLFQSLLLHFDFSLLYFSSISLIKKLTKNDQDSKFKREKNIFFKTHHPHTKLLFSSVRSKAKEPGNCLRPRFCVPTENPVTRHRCIYNRVPPGVPFFTSP